MDSDQPATTQSGEMVLAKFDNHPGEENMEMEVGQQMEEQVLGYLEVQPSQLQAVQEGGTIYFQSDGLELDEQLILAQGGEGGEIIVVVRTDQDGLGFTGEGGESALRAVKFGDLAGLAQQMGLAPGTKISLQSDDKDDESGTTYLTYETTGEEYGHEMQENLQTSEIVGDENATKDVYLQEHGELTEVPVSVSEDGIRIIEKPYDNTNSCNEENIMHIVDNVSEDNIRENNGNQCYITVGVNGNEINTIENYNPTLAQVAEQERLINSPAKHPIVVHLSRDTNQSVHHESQATSTEILQEQNNFHTSNAEDQFLEKKECEMYQTTIVTSEDGQQQLEYHIVQSSEIGDGSQGHASISEADCYGQWSAMETSGQELSNEMTIVENSAEENIAVVSQQSGVETNSIDSVSNNKITSITEPPVNETLRSIEEFLRTGETEEHPTNESDSVPTEAKTESTEVVETESKQEAIIIETNEEGLPTEISLESDSQDMSGMIMEEMPQNTTSYVVINLDSPSQFTNAMGNSIQMESVNFKSVVNEHGQSVGILETANGDLEVILDSESLVPSTNSTFSKENHDEDEISVISNHSSSMQEVLNPQIHKAFQKLLSTPEKKSTSLSEPTTYQVNLASAKTKVNSKHQSVSDGPKRGDKTSKAAKETLKEKKMTIFDIGGASEDLTVKIPTRQYSRTYSRKKTTPVPAATTSKEIPPIVDVQESEFGRNEIILVIEPNDSPSNDYDKLEIGNNENSTQDVIGLSSNAGTPKERKTVSILNVSKETSDENKIEIDTTKSPIKETSLAVENQVSNVEEMEVDNAIMVMAKSEKDKVAEDGKITEQNDIQTSTVSDNTAEQSEGNIELPNEIDSELFFELPQTAPISTSHEISTDLEGTVNEEENQPLTEEENQPLTEEENQPLTEVENQPLTEEENQPLTEVENQPLTEEENQPLIEEENQSLIEEENQSLIEEENQSLIEEENQSLIEEENQSLIEVENQALIEEENQPSINSIEIAEETTFKNSHDLSEFHEYKVVTSTKTDSAGLEIFGVPHEASTEPQEAASVPQKHLVAPQEAVAVPQETVAVPLEAVAIPQESVSVPQDILNVQEDQANPDSSEPQDTVSLPQEDVSIPLEAASVPGDVLPVTQDLDNLSQNEELIELKSMPVPDESQDDDLLSESQGVDTLSESTGMVFKDSTVTTGQDQVALEKEFIEIAKKSSPVAKKSLPIVKDKVAIAKKSLVVKKTGKKYEKEKVFVDSENDKAETDNDKESEVEKMDMENDIRDSSFRAEKLASADEENSHYGFDQDESMNDKDNDEIMKESIILDDSQLDSIQIGANENELKQKRGRKRQVDEQLDKDGKRVKPNQQKDSTATSLSVIKEKNIKRKLFNESATGKKLGRPKKSSTGNKAYQSQDELFDELLKDTLPNASKKRKSDVKDYSRKPNTASGEAKRRRTLPPRLPNDFASSDEDDVVLSNLYSYPGKKYKSLSQGKRGRGRGKTGRPKIFKNQGSSDEEEVMMSNLRIYPEFKEQRPGFGESSKRGRGRSRIAKNVSSNSNRYDIDSQEPLSKSEPNKRGRGRPRGALIRRKARSMSAKKQAKDFKIHFCYQQSNPEKQHQIYSCKECHFRTSRLANIIWHYKECSLDLFPFKSSSVGERTPTRFKLDGGTSSKSLPENRFPNRKLDAPKKISPSKSDRSSKSNRNKRAEDGTGLRDDNSLGTDDRESSDFTCESDEEDTYDIEMKNTFGFAENDVVWAEWRNQHWPALVRKIYPRQKKVSVFFIATPMPSKGFTMNVRKVTNFDDAAKNKDFLEKGFSLQKTDQLVKSVQLAEEYLRKKCLGLKISALQFFNNPEAAKQILSELEESAENQGSDLSDSAMNDPPTPVAIIDLDRLTNPAQEEMSELVDETDLQTNKDDDALEAEKLIKCIQEGNCNEHLIQVYNGDVNSERHRLFSSGLEVDRGCVRRASVYKGVVTDEGKKVELTHYCVEFFKKKLVCVEGFNIVAYAYEVMVPEAILKAISLLNKISLTEAEAIFGKNDIDKTQSVFTTVRESEGQVICVVLEKSDEKLMETGENDKDENISNPDSSSTCPKSQTELPT